MSCWIDDRSLSAVAVAKWSWCNSEKEDEIIKGTVLRWPLALVTFWPSLLAVIGFVFVSFILRYEQRGQSHLVAEGSSS